MAKYLITIHEDEREKSKAPQATLQQLWDDHNRFAEQISERGAVLISGEPLETGPIMTVRDGVASDETLPEKAETLNGYYLIETADRQLAVELTRMCPAPFGAVTLRPIWDMPEPGN
ncbi:YciI family protein [Streptomyces sioyaensis]|uniref:YciI family protein n=1 Tax=Streptomyces sioyaensis TaxID=67364 RepID=UPI0036EA5541